VQGCREWGDRLSFKYFVFTTLQTELRLARYVLVLTTSRKASPSRSFRDSLESRLTC
jgi:hypothetical protein